MASVATYITFPGETEAAFNFYKSVFGGDFTSFMRIGDVPPATGMSFTDEEKKLVMNVQYPIFGGHVLMGNDVPHRMGSIIVGNNVSINLMVDNVEQGKGFFAALSAGGKVGTEFQEMFWGHWGQLTDKFGVRWMVNCNKQTN
ncbi:MAG: VOC family protein [Hydrotalea sp.]|nr:VOC family protein [Hydrotalea sp.]